MDYCFTSIFGCYFELVWGTIAKAIDVAKAL
jgi:hypothetical protein